MVGRAVGDTDFSSVGGSLGVYHFIINGFP